MVSLLNGQVSVSKDLLWSAVFGSEFIQHPWWLELVFDDESEWDVAGLATLTVEDPEDDSKAITFEVDSEKLAKALAEAIDRGYINKDVLDWLPDDLDLDANDGDVIAQIMAFGEVIYG